MYNSDNLKELRKEKKECLYSIKVNDGKTYTDLHKINKNIEEECKMIEEYSYFDVRSLGKILSNIASIFEKERFVCQEITCVDPKAIDTVREKNMMIIIAEKYMNKKMKYYDKNYLYSLIKYNNAIILATEDQSYMFDSNIPIYSYNDMYGLELNVKFKWFSYLKEFIDLVIKYKMDESLIGICDEELNKLKDIFVTYKSDEILRRHEIIKYWDEDTLKERQKQEDVYYNKLLKRIKKRIEK